MTSSATVISCILKSFKDHFEDSLYEIWQFSSDFYGNFLFLLAFYRGAVI